MCCSAQPRDEQLLIKSIGEDTTRCIYLLSAWLRMVGESCDEFLLIVFVAFIRIIDPLRSYMEISHTGSYLLITGSSAGSLVLLPSKLKNLLDNNTIQCFSNSTTSYALITTPQIHNR